MNGNIEMNRTMVNNRVACKQFLYNFFSVTNSYDNKIKAKDEICLNIWINTG